MNNNIFTTKEQAVFDLFEQDFKPKEISNKLNISLDAVKSRLKRIKQKISIKKLSDSSVLVNESIDDFWKKQYNELLKEKSFEEKFLDIFKQKTIVSEPIKNALYLEPEVASKSYILMLADFHLGETVNKDQMGGLNEYSESTARDRLDVLYSKIKSLIDHKQYNKLDIFLMGDMVCGNIHDELIGDISITDQILNTVELLYNFICKLFNYFKHIDVSCVFGNHGRMSKKPTYKNRQNNFDYLVYKMLQLKFSTTSDIHFDIPKDSFIIKNINNKNFFISHGDILKNSSSSAMDDLDKNFSQILMNKYNIMINYFCFGHYHTANTITKIGGKIITSGSLKGTDEFALYKCVAFSNASQTFIEMDTEDIRWIADIKLD